MLTSTVCCSHSPFPLFYWSRLVATASAVARYCQDSATVAQAVKAGSAVSDALDRRGSVAAYRLVEKGEMCSNRSASPDNALGTMSARSSCRACDTRAHKSSNPTRDLQIQTGLNGSAHTATVQVTVDTDFWQLLEFGCLWTKLMLRYRLKYCLTQPWHAVDSCCSTRKHAQKSQKSLSSCMYVIA